LVLGARFEHPYAPERIPWVAYELLAEQYGSPYYANLGNPSKATEFIEQAIRLAQERHQPLPNWPNTFDLYAFH